MASTRTTWEGSPRRIREAASNDHRHDPPRPQMLLVAVLVGTASGLLYPAADLLRHGFRRFLVLRLVIQSSVIGALLAMLVCATYGSWLAVIFFILGLVIGRVGAAALEKAVDMATWDIDYNPDSLNGLERDLLKTIPVLIAFVGAAIAVLH